MTDRLSFTTMATPNLDHRGAIELALEHGMSGVDIRCSDHLGEITLASTDADLAAVKADFAAAGLDIPGILCYNKIDPTKADCWETFAGDLERHLAIAEKVGAKAIRIFGGYAADGQSMDEFIRLSAKVIRAALEANPTAIGIIIQNHLRSYNAPETVRLAQAVDNPRFGIVFSPDHCLLMNDGAIANLLPAVAPWTKQVYIADMTVSDGKHSSVFPGQGDVPLRDTVRFFRERGFTGTYSFKWEKIWTAKLPDAEEALPHFLAFMRSV